MQSAVTPASKRMLYFHKLLSCIISIFFETFLSCNSLEMCNNHMVAIANVKREVLMIRDESS